MDNHILCPLSKSSNIILVEKIEVKNLIKLYSKSLKDFDINSEFSAVSEIEFYHCLDSDLRFFYPAVTGSELFYERLGKMESYYMNDKNEYDYASQLIEASDSVLEIGSGKGAFAKKISAQSYLGLEFNRKCQEIAASNGICVIDESIQSHAINYQNCYDVVCAFQVLEHIEEVRSFIEASIACLKPGGLLIYSVPSVDSFSRYVSNLILDLPPHHVTRWSDTALRNIAKYFSLEMIEVWHEPLQFVHRQLYAQTIVKNSLFNLVKKNVKVVDFSFASRAIDVIGRNLGKIFANGLTSNDLMPRGISVTSVYRKLPK